MEVLLPDTRGQRKLKSLLFISLFVGNIAADCSKPLGLDNMVPTSETLLKNDFPNGSEVTFECGNGYNKDGGSGTSKCLNEIWTEPDLICKKMDCGQPEALANMRFNIPAGTLFGSTIFVFCDGGYQIAGLNYKQCISSGWFGNALCEIVSCEKPSQVPNGRNSWKVEENPKYKEVIHYSCDDGYTLSGPSSITCSSNGQYSSQPPECIALSSATSSTISATHKDTAVITSSPAAVSTSEQGARYLWPAEEKAATTSVTSQLLSSSEDEDIETLSTNKNNGAVALPLTVALVSVAAVATVVALFLYKFQLRRKGSYDTREDLKPELLHFQNL
ncbi:complement decay-accelerating factor, GPI-anchored isoform X6 [Kryptolebias marmoratus]|uniref:complement decay-accelerating factor, GPI-anchored isoform X6 n=1 Tax=Kryptolebias marmoratus TaxID=37003 RepID=UPI0007F8B16F|nr:complement decay-accelerating factor, GPI-anchored isoform X6 [Kryptolebias marmoratus]